MLYTIAKQFQNILFNLTYCLSRLWLRLLGVKIGKNLKALFITTLDSPRNIHIGNNVWISNNVALYAINGIHIGNDVIIAKDVSIISGDHGFSQKLIAINKQGIEIGKPPIIIGDDVWIGEKAILLKSIKIGKGCVIGAGSVVTRSIPPYSIVGGNPAKIIRMRK